LAKDVTVAEIARKLPLGVLNGHQAPRTQPCHHLHRPGHQALPNRNGGAEDSRTDNPLSELLQAAYAVTSGANAAPLRDGLVLMLDDDPLWEEHDGGE